MRAKVVAVVASTVTRVLSCDGVRTVLKWVASTVPSGVNHDLIAGSSAEKCAGGKRQGACGAKKELAKEAGVATRRRGSGRISR